MELNKKKNKLIIKKSGGKKVIDVREVLDHFGVDREKYKVVNIKEEDQKVLLVLREKHVKNAFVFSKDFSNGDLRNMLSSFRNSLIPPVLGVEKEMLERFQK